MEDILLFRKLMRTKIGQHDSIPLMRDVKEGINREVRILPESKVVSRHLCVVPHSRLAKMAAYSMDTPTCGSNFKRNCSDQAASQRTKEMLTHQNRTKKKSGQVKIRQTQTSFSGQPSFPSWDISKTEEANPHDEEKKKKFRHTHTDTLFPPHTGGERRREKQPVLAQGRKRETACAAQKRTRERRERQQQHSLPELKTKTNFRHREGRVQKKEKVFEFFYAFRSAFSQSFNCLCYFYNFGFDQPKALDTDWIRTFRTIRPI